MWEWDQILEILLDPHVLNDCYQTEKWTDESILGMVGTGAMTRMVILSNPDLLAGFRQSEDRHYVSIHEFTHLWDKSDGVVGGVPEVAVKPMSRPKLETNCCFIDCHSDFNT